MGIARTLLAAALSLGIAQAAAPPACRAEDGPPPPAQRKPPKDCPDGSSSSVGGCRPEQAPGQKAGQPAAPKPPFPLLEKSATPVCNGDRPCARSSCRIFADRVEHLVFLGEIGTRRVERLEIKSRQRGRLQALIEAAEAGAYEEREPAPGKEPDPDRVRYLANRITRTRRHGHTQESASEILLKRSGGPAGEYANVAPEARALVDFIDLHCR